MDINNRNIETLEEKVPSIGMKKRDFKKLTKTQLIRLLLNQEKNRQAQKSSNSIKEYEGIIRPPEQFRDGQKPIPPPRIGNRENVKPKPAPRKSVKQMVIEYENLILPPPEQFRDGYKPIPKSRTDRPIQMQNVRKPPKPKRPPPPPPIKEPIYITDVPVPMI